MAPLGVTCSIECTSPHPLSETFQISKNKDFNGPYLENENEFFTKSFKTFFRTSESRDRGKLVSAFQLTFKELPLSSGSKSYYPVPMPKAKTQTLIKENPANFIDNKNILSAGSCTTDMVNVIHAMAHTTPDQRISTHSSIMAFKNSREHPLFSKFGLAPVYNFRGCSVQISYNLNCTVSNRLDCLN